MNILTAINKAKEILSWNFSEEKKGQWVCCNSLYQEWEYTKNQFNKGKIHQQIFCVLITKQFTIPENIETKILSATNLKAENTWAVKKRKIDQKYHFCNISKCKIQFDDEILYVCKVKWKD